MSDDSKTVEPKKSKLATYAMLHAIFLLYSVGAICSKMAAGFSFPSVGFIGWYAGLLAVLGIYALLWQRVLKRLPLTTAFANKGVTIVWGMLWGVLFFGETISPTMVIGAALVFVGILLVVMNSDG